MNKIETINRLKDSFRMFHLEEDNNGVNRTQGLFMLCEDTVKENFTIAEIGSFCGISSEVLSLYCKKIYCIDTWEDWSGDGIIFEAMARFDSMKSNYSHIEKLHMTGKEASEKFPDEHFDLVYIDASHWYKDVLDDIKTWIPKVKPGGYLSGHDYIHGIDTSKAVNDYFGKTHSITIYPDSSWIIKKYKDDEKNILSN